MSGKKVVELQAVAEAQNHSGQIDPFAGFVQTPDRCWQAAPARRGSLVPARERPRRSGQAEGTQAVLTGLGKRALADGASNRRRCGRDGTLPESERSGPTQFAGFGQAEIGGLSRQVADGAIVGRSRGRPRTALSTVIWTLCPSTTSCSSPQQMPRLRGKAPRAAPWLKTPRWSNSRSRCFRDSDCQPIESRFPRITAILEKKKSRAACASGRCRTGEGKELAGWS